MSKYTTGEIAKLCNVSVRTVQYYDSRNILIPSELSEGGRRLYTDEELNKMKIICFLRNMGFSIENISSLFSEANSDRVINILIEEQSRNLNAAITDQQQKLDKLTEMKKNLKNITSFSVNSLNDIAIVMNNQKKRKKVLAKMLTVGIIMDIIEIGTIILGIKTGIWWPFIIGLPLVIAMGIYISYYYYKNISYICPECHKIFKSSFKETFFAPHTPKTRMLTCPNCGHKGFCVETYGGKDAQGEENQE